VEQGGASSDQKLLKAAVVKHGWQRMMNNCFGKWTHWCKKDQRLVMGLP
jgi:hypothetical protein